MRRFLYTVFLLIIVFFIACKSTELVNVWADRSVKTKYENLAVIAFIKERAVRNAIEEQVVEYFERNGVKMRRGNIIVHEDLDVKPKVLEQALKDKGIDGVLVLKPICIDRSIQSDAPAYGVGFYITYPVWGSYFYGACPAVVSTTTVFKIENDLYDAVTKKKVWSAQTNTFDPSDAKTIGRGVANAVFASLKSKGLIVTPEEKKKNENKRNKETEENKENKENEE